MSRSVPRREARGSTIVRTSPWVESLSAGANVLPGIEHVNAAGPCHWTGTDFPGQTFSTMLEAAL